MAGNRHLRISDRNHTLLVTNWLYGERSRVEEINMYVAHGNQEVHPDLPLLQGRRLGGESEAL